MKKSYKIIGVLLLFIGLIIVGSLVSPNNDEKVESTTNTTDSENMEDIFANAQKESASIGVNEKKYFINIDVNEYLIRYQQPEYSIILLRRDGCQYCQVAEPILQKISKDYQIDIYSLSSDTFTEADIETFINSDERFQSSFGTPFLMIVGNNQLKDSIGVSDYSHYVQFLLNNQIIEG